jgi:predicted PurR-regulated permease PerM
LAGNIDDYLKQGLSWLLQHLGSVFGSFVKTAASSFLFLIALYYLLKDGRKFKAVIIALSPLSDTDDETISQKLAVAIHSVMKGSLLIAFIQGVLTSVGFAIFGVPNAVLWGSVAAIAALIPGIGTALVLIPAILFLFLRGEAFSGVGLIVWGMGAVGLIDNFLGPKLVGRGTQLHPLIILLSVLGSIVFFGPIGFLLGPLIMSLLFALLDIYSSLMGKKNLG